MYRTALEKLKKIPVDQAHRNHVDMIQILRNSTEGVEPHTTDLCIRSIDSTYKKSVSEEERLKLMEKAVLTQPNS